MTMARRKDKYASLPPSGAANEAAPAPATHAVEVPASSVHAYTNSLLERVIQLLLISLLSIGVQVSDFVTLCRWQVGCRGLSRHGRRRKVEPALQCRCTHKAGQATRGA
mgnify:CR=1 FL=1